MLIHSVIIKALLISVSLFSGYVWAQQDSTAESQDQPAILESWQDGYFADYIVGLVDTQALLGDYVQSFGETIDDFFGDDSLPSQTKGSRLTIYSPLTFYDNGDTVHRVNFRAELDLPKTNHRWKLLFANWQDDDLSQTPRSPETQTNRAIDNNNQSLLGARYLLDKDESGFSHIESGLKFEEVIDPNPYIKYLKRFRYSLTGKLLSLTSHQLYLERHDGFAWEGQQIFDYQLNKTQLGRSQSTLTWWNQEKNLYFNQKFLLLEKDSVNTASAYYADTTWLLDENSAGFETVALGINWRSRLYKDWLFAEIEPQVSFNKSDDFSKANLSTTLMLEMHFYRDK